MHARLAFRLICDLFCVSTARLCADYVHFSSPRLLFLCYHRKPQRQMAAPLGSQHPLQIKADSPKANLLRILRHPFNIAHLFQIGRQPHPHTHLTTPVGCVILESLQSHLFPWLEADCLGRVERLLPDSPRALESAGFPRTIPIMSERIGSPISLQLGVIG